MNRRLVCAVWALAAVAVTGLEAPRAIAFPVMFGFLCFVPGFALVSRLRLQSLGIEVAIAFGVSMALAAIVTEVLMYAELYSALPATLTLALITLTACAWPVSRTRASQLT
ncbi:MAG TPA: hypothetical protein VFX21_07120 [Acidimicrobiia bacterium]|nr:hypothetical protein [Acidimicrobiia bacterium]